ncbi:MAG: glycosyltransferase family A protein [Xanthomonadales bacterium]|nr:glycosyltransferase family A protein [Xanthomonadales bacterium]
MTAPTFTVIVPTCNRLEKLQRALSSVAQQTFLDYEVIVVDDGSMDGTGKFIASMKQAGKFPGIPSLHVISNKNGKGAGLARNQALAKARGKLIAFLDDDDVWMPGYLQLQATRLQQHPGAGASVAAHIEFDQTGHEHLPDLVPLFEYQEQIIHLLTESFVHTMSVLVARRSVFEEIGVLNPGLRVCHDWDWCIRLLSAGHGILPPTGDAMVRREIPGGLVLQLRKWFQEEQSILKEVFQRDATAKAHRRHVQAYRNLLFARIAISRGEFGFAFSRLGHALGYAPFYSIKLARLKWARSRQAGKFHESQRSR